MSTFRIEILNYTSIIMFKVMQLSHWKFKARAQSNTKMFDFPI